MRIGIDLRFTAASCMGTGTYAETAALSLASARSPDDHLIGFTESALTDGALGRVLSQRILPGRHAGQSPIDAQRLLFDASIEREGLDVFMAPAGIGPQVATCPVVTTVHDVLFEQHSAYFGDSLLRYLKREVPRSLHAADLIIAISEATKRAVQAHYGIAEDRIRVVHQPIRELFRTKPRAESIAATLAELSLASPYLLTLTNHAPHKNTAFLLPLFAAWLRRTRHPTFRLVVAGGGLSPQAPVDLQGIAERLGIADRIVITGRIADRHLPGLYAGATAFLYPSLHEGWGLPPLEAIAMGTPVVVSDRGGLPEAVADAGLVLPLDERQWDSAIDTVLATSPNDRLRDAMARRTAAILTSSGESLRTCLREAITRYRTQGMARIVQEAPRAAKTEVVPHQRPRRIVSLSGCMIIRNGVRLGYPFVEAIQAAIDQVDEMVVVDGCSDDETWPILQRMAAACPHLRISKAPWTATATGGHAIAAATNHALRLCRSSHILSIQADEIHTTSNLQRLRAVLNQGADYAAMPFIHFRSSWWSILVNPAYTATIRCVPNSQDVMSVDDGTTFTGPQGRCAPPDAFPDPIYHVGWVYAPNIIAKHQSHAKLYADHASYQVKADKATRLGESADAEGLASIDDEYRLIPFTGAHPAVIAHLIPQERYEAKLGLERWFARWRDGQGAPSTHGTPSTPSAILDFSVPAPYRFPPTAQDPLCAALRRLAARADIRTILEVGSGDGSGTTQALIDGLRFNRDAHLHCLELTDVGFASLVGRHGRNPQVACHRMSSIPADAFPTDDEVAAFHAHSPPAFRQFPLPTVLMWLERDRHLVRSSGVPQNGIELLLQRNSQRRFDLVVIDGSEFTGLRELDALLGSAIIVLDDILCFKNHASMQRLQADPAYVLREAQTDVRHGYAIYERRQPIRQAHRDASHSNATLAGASR